LILFYCAASLIACPQMPHTPFDVVVHAACAIAHRHAAGPAAVAWPLEGEYQSLQYSSIGAGIFSEPFQEMKFSSVQSTWFSPKYLQFAHIEPPFGTRIPGW
jgi:hypothetical protein